MQRLSLPDSHHLSAAIGWLELGKPLEADEELEKISPASRNHPDVLEMRCLIYSVEKKWEDVVDIANAIVLADMTRVDAWLNRSEALHHLKRTQEAYDHLETAVDLFRHHWRVHYNLACYACQLGRKQKAWQHLVEAIQLGGEKAVKLRALADPLLGPFWAELGEI